MCSSIYTEVLCIAEELWQKTNTIYKEKTPKYSQTSQKEDSDYLQ